MKKNHIHDPLERKKLELEIRKLKMPFWKDPELIRTALTLLALIISIFVAYNQGLFDTEKSKLELDKSKLELDIANFKTEKAKIIDSIRVQNSVKDSLERSINMYDQQLQNILGRIHDLTGENFRIGKNLSDTKEQYKKDKSFYENELIQEYKQKRKQLTEMQSAKKQLQDQADRIDLQDAEIEYLKSKAELSPDEKRELEALKFKLRSAANTAKAKKLIKDLDSLDKKLKEDLNKTKNMTNEEMKKWFDLYFLRSKADKN